MRIILITFWLLVPLALAAYHYGPGQSHLKLDYAERALVKARAAAENQDWESAITAYQKAITHLPKEHEEVAVRIRIEVAKAQIQNGGLPQAREDLIELVNQLKENKQTTAELMEDAVSTLANARYYMTYLMKLEGQPPVEWEPEIEAARQEYKLLAQTGVERDRHLSDLEAAIRLARAEPKDLYGLPIPKP
ncbi:MAG: hypothetical protein AAF226_08865 [Verrucomicrobiota bacterium]